jgi:2-phospho-L-lactate guanylyltransferase
MPARKTPITLLGDRCRASLLRVRRRRRAARLLRHDPRTSRTDEASDVDAEDHDGCVRDATAERAAVTRRAPARWSVVVPVKALHLAKSRLGGLPAPRRAELALAMALDTVAAATASARVAAVLVTAPDGRVAPAVRSLGADAIEDERGAGLNPALRHAAAIATARQYADGVAALTADLPALTPAALSAALEAAASCPVSFVADASGEGTTLLCARPDATFEPQFGAGSAARHRAAGAVALEPAGIDTLRRDVDTPADLAAARALGLGRRTAALFRDRGGEG